MSSRRTKRWLRLYELAAELAFYDPWSLFKETDTFLFVPKDSREEHFFSFIAESRQQLGIARYIGGNNYIAAQARLHSPNPKKEPAFLLQDGIIALWGDREDVSKENYTLIKELGLEFHGRGTWLHFEQYRTGYAPCSISPDDLNSLIDDLENLCMMVRPVYEGRMPVDFSNGTIMVRHFLKRENLYLNFYANIDIPQKVLYNKVNVTDNTATRHMRSLPAKGTIALDWSYLPTSLLDAGDKIIPKLLLAVDSASGIILSQDVLQPSTRPHLSLFDFIDDLTERFGKPETIEICSDEIWAYLHSFCELTGIKLIRKKNLPHITKARNALIKQILR